MIYNQLLNECSKSDIDVYEMDLINKGLYLNGIIALSCRLLTVEKTCILAEELGHHETTVGNILDQTKIENVKQEKRARNWAYEKLIKIESLISAHKNGCRNKFEVAEYLEVTESFLEDTIKHYKEKYGLYYTVDNYIIYFEPLGILEMFTSADGSK